MPLFNHRVGSSLKRDCIPALAKIEKLTMRRLAEQAGVSLRMHQAAAQGELRGDTETAQLGLGLATESVIGLDLD